MTEKWFQPEWRLTLFTLLLLPLMISLGFWQLDRAEEKRAMSALYAERLAAAAQPLDEVAADDWRYRQVRLSGRFIDEELWLLDNQLFQGQVGYNVVMPFQLQDGGIVMVDRGWVAGNPDRRILPQLESVAGEVTLVGTVYVPTAQPFTLAATALPANWPKVVQHLPWQALPRQQQLALPYVVRLNPESAALLQANWLVVNVSPDKHTGYAVQWFAMSAMLALLYIIASTPLKQRLKRKQRSTT